MMLLDPGHPMDTWIESSFIGHLSIGSVQQALKAVASRHPLITAAIELINGKRCWVGSEKPIPLVLGEPEQLPSWTIVNPESGNGMCCYLSQGARGSRLWMQVHHTVCDGAGIRLLFHDFATAYAQIVGPKETAPEHFTLEPSLLSLRGRIPPPPASGPATFSSLWRGLREVLGFIFPWPEALAPRPDPSRTSRAPFSSKIFSAQQTQQILGRAREAGGQLNEQAISDLFATLADWQVQRGRNKPNSRIRILIPMDLRELEERRLPACNRVTFAFLSRFLKDCGPDLTASLRGESAYIRRYRTDLDFLRGLELVRAWNLLSPILRIPVSLSTSVLTNMGNVTPLRGFKTVPEGVALGDAVCEWVTSGPTVRPGTFASFSLCLMAGRLAVGIRCLESHIGYQGEQWLLDNFCLRLLGAQPQDSAIRSV